MLISRSLVAVCACFALIGCGTLPASGPGVNGLLAETAPEGTPPLTEIELIELTPAAAAAMERPAVTIPATPPSAPRNTTSALFGLKVGDRISILIQEAATSVNGEETAAIPLPPQVIDASGRVMAPFAGPVKIVGMTPVAAAKRIQDKLEGQLVEPQVVVSLLEPVGRSVSVVGDAIRGGGLFPIRTGGETMLQAIAATGGFSLPLHATRVRLTRGDVSTTVRAEALSANPALNARLAPGDVLSVEIASRSFTVLGAVGAPGRIDFAAPRITLAEALAQARGLNDLSAAPQGVALLRRREAEIPLLYRLDLRDRDGLIAAQLADVADGDLIYVANAPITDLEKVLRIIGLTTGPLLTTTAITGLNNN